MRLDQYTVGQWPEYSRSVWQKYIKRGYVSVDGVVKTNPSLQVDEANVITIDIPEQTNYSKQTLPVIYEDENVVVINKPVGILSHSKGAINEEFTVAEFFRDKTTYNSDTDRPGIVHRLDRDTSGVMIGAKNSDAARLLSQQFQDRRAKKTYFAVVDGIPKEEQAHIDLPIGRNPKSPSSFRIDPNGKSAQTYYEVVKRSSSRSLVRLRPTTGRTHQLRVHMAYIGTPIRGDVIYGKAADRLFLHAAQLEITIPGSPSNERKTFEAPLPSEFNREIQ
ncbi:MAG TPA: RluA family pseudouridine synthase [Candidatus Saccharimonadales bacterium]